MAEPPIPYIAGVLDAAALFRVVEVSGGSLLPRIMVHGLPIPVLEVLARHTGTTVVTASRSYNRAPCLDHCTEQHQHIDSVSGRWSLTGAKATVVIWSVLPHLLFRTKEATEALDCGLRAPRKKATFGKMMTLGWPLPDLPVSIGVA